MTTNALMTKTAVEPYVLRELASQVNDEHERAEATGFEYLAHARQAGDLLNRVKEALPHGAFVQWITENCTFQVRTAQLYMRVANGWSVLESKTQRVAHLSFRQAQNLLAADAPYVTAGGAAREIDELPPSQDAHETTSSTNEVHRLTQSESRRVACSRNSSRARRTSGLSHQRSGSSQIALICRAAAPGSWNTTLADLSVSSSGYATGFLSLRASA